ncbi:MAG: flagellar biosynthetic protein FliO [Deltaproteobacteria bacterium]|nr:flagellar biosynthetic protein FliO [Deltaproteobacteria bacterium]
MPGALNTAATPPPHVSLWYTELLVQSLVSLAVASLLFWITIRWVGRVRFPHEKGLLRVLEQKHLDAKRALYLVQVVDKVLLLGTGENGAPVMLSELDAKQVKIVEPPPSSLPIRFKDWLRLRGGAQRENRQDGKGVSGPSSNSLDV